MTSHPFLQEGKTREAARTSATYDYYHPRNIHIKNNMKYYKSLKEVTEEDLVTMETVQYVSHVGACFRLYLGPEIPPFKEIAILL